MKIILTSNSFWSIANFRLGLIKFLKKKNCKIILISSDDLKKKILRKYCYKIYEVPKIKRGYNFLSFINLVSLYYKIFKIEKPNIILSFTLQPNLITGLLARYFNIPNIVMITGMGYAFTSKSFLATIFTLLYKICLKNTDHIFFQNKHDYIFFKKKKIKFLNFSIVPGSGINLKKFKFYKIKNKKNVNFLMVSRNIIEKGIYEYIEAIKLVKNTLKNVFFFHVGYSINKGKNVIQISEFKKWKKEGLINYYKHKDNIINLIKNSDCIVLPTYREGLPRSVIEGFAIGRPAIISKVIGTDNLIQENINGFYCKPKDPISLSKKIIKFYNLSFNKKVYLSNNCRKSSLYFNEKKVIDRYWSVIKRINKND